MNVNPLALLSNDHRAVEDLFARFDSSDFDRGVTIRRLIDEMTLHAEIEEEVLYPTIRRNVEGGRQLAKQAEQEHQQVKEMLDRLGDMDLDSREADALISQLHQDWQHHVAEEEGPDGLFVQLQASMDEESLGEMAPQLMEAKMSRSGLEEAEEPAVNPPPKDPGGSFFKIRP